MPAPDHHSNLRRLRPTDADCVLQILRESPGAATWSRGGLQQLVEQPGVVAFICEDRSTAVGLIVARQAADEAEILNMAVRPHSRRAGHGSALLLAALRAFQSQGATRAFLEVRASNAGAIAFYGKHGFVPTVRRKGYYQDPYEDAVVMEKKLTA